MIRHIIRRCGVILAMWLPFFAIWVLFAMSVTRDRFSAVLLTSLISMGSAGLLGIAVWRVCKRWPCPVEFTLSFYLLQLSSAIAYAVVWTAAVYGLESMHRGTSMHGFCSWPSLSRQLLTGIWFYALYAGVSYAVQTRDRLHEKEKLATRAEALAAAARLEAIRARLNPHFLFNALHTLAALGKFRPEITEAAIERLGDMLRYTLEEDGRELVEFSEEYDFTRQYLSFEQLRYEDRLKIDWQLDSESFNFDIPPFSMQTLVENAVHHAISLRPEGGSILIKCSCRDGKMRLSVRDDGPGGAAGPGHQFGLRSLRERLRAAYGPSADLQIHSGVDGFEASFVIPSASDLCRGRKHVGRFG